MSKKSFNDIELVIKNTIEANEPAFKEASWKKMEALLDKDEDPKRPFIFWLWLLIPLLIVTGGAGYFAFNKNSNTVQTSIPGKTDNAEQVVAEQKNLSKENNTNSTPGFNNSGKTASLNNVDARDKNTNYLNTGTPVTKKTSSLVAVNNNKPANNDELLYSKNKLTNNTKRKMKASITAASPEAADDLTVNEQLTPAALDNDPSVLKQQEEVIVVKIETNSKDEKEIEKIIDSVIEKSVANKKDKTKSSRFYIIVAGGAETSGTKLFSADKITGRAGIAAGYQLNKHLSIQTGFFVSNKKYKADGSSYKTKPGTYWNIVDIKEIEANCRVYEIPLQVNYNFTPGKKLNIFASVGLSSYIMKKEDYSFHYSRYGTYHQAEVYYSGNKNLFSVLKISGGIEKKVGQQFSLFAAPGIAIPIAGVGEGEVKLYSTEILIGLKFTPARRNK